MNVCSLKTHNAHFTGQSTRAFCTAPLLKRRLLTMSCMHSCIEMDNILWIIRNFHLAKYFEKNYHNHVLISGNCHYQVHLIETKRRRADIQYIHSHTMAIRLSAAVSQKTLPTASCETCCLSSPC